jgi:hypothetical protein
MKIANIVVTTSLQGTNVLKDNILLYDFSIIKNKAQNFRFVNSPTSNRKCHYKVSIILIQNKIRGISKPNPPFLLLLLHAR